MTNLKNDNQQINDEFQFRKQIVLLSEPGMTLREVRAESGTGFCGLSMLIIVAW